MVTNNSVLGAVAAQSLDYQLRYDNDSEIEYYRTPATSRHFSQHTLADPL
jgi:hypothetical protein